VIVKEAPASDEDQGATYVPKRGRPSVRQAQAIAQHILRKAQDLFLTDGYAQTTMEAVATAAGISKGTLYARYPSKSDLFHALITDRLEAWNKLTPAWVNEPDISLFDYLYRRGSAMMSAMAEPEIRAFSHLVQSEARQFPELAEDFKTEAYDKLIDEVATEIHRICSADGSATTDARGVALVYVHAITGWWKSKGPDPEVPKAEADHYLARLLSLLLGGRAAF
jgi:TetR/AcrR family transcriptional repressor of mexJK operon